MNMQEANIPCYCSFHSRDQFRSESYLSVLCGRPLEPSYWNKEQTNSVSSIGLSSNFLAR